MKDASENVKRINCGLSVAKTEGRVDTPPRSRKGKRTSTRTFMRPTKQSPIFFETKIDLDEVGVRKQMHDHSTGINMCVTYRYLSPTSHDPYLILSIRM
jgi:hypothetical protein